MIKGMASHTRSSVFITFSGNCREAFMLYHKCFGGDLQMHLFEQPLPGFTVKPVLKAVLKSSKLLLYGSDMVYDEGRRIGNYMAVLIHCSNNEERCEYIEQLRNLTTRYQLVSDPQDALIEIVDRFDVRWVFMLATQVSL